MPDPEADKIVPMDGDFTLDQTKAECVIEQSSNYQFLSSEEATTSEDGVVVNFNNVAFVANLDQLPELLFEELGGNNPETIKKQKKGQGWTWLWNGAMWVEGTNKNVIVFAK